MNKEANIKCVVIGGSAGSFSVVTEILKHLPEDFQPAVIICLHRLKSAREGFVEALSMKSKLKVKEPFDKERIKSNTVYLAPANYHMYIEPNYTFALSTEELWNYSRPAIDLTLKSAAKVYKNKVVGIILSGANKDGAAGIKAIKDYGGIVIVQDVKESMVATMPLSAKRSTNIDYEFTVNQIIKYLEKLNQNKKEKSETSLRN